MYENSVTWSEFISVEFVTHDDDTNSISHILHRSVFQFSTFLAYVSIMMWKCEVF